MIDKNPFTIVFGIFFLLTVRDIFLGHPAATQEPQATHHHHELSSAPYPAANLQTGRRSAGSTLTVQYCHSCGYRQAFEEISKLVTASYPDVVIVGELHQPSWFRSQLINLVFFSKIAITLMLFMDYNPFERLQMNTPQLWTTMRANKLSSCLLLLFIANSIESNMMSTGAFEMFYNEIPVWSKLQTGRMPSAPEIFQIMKSHHSSVASAGAASSGGILSSFV